MRVLQLGAYPPPYGGVQVNLVSIRNYLRELGIPCAVINLTRHRDSRADQLYHPTTALEVIRLLARLRYDIVHMHLGGDVTRRLLGLYSLCSVLPGKRTVLTFHSGGYPSSARGSTARWWSLRGFVFRRLDRIIVVNREMTVMFREFGVSSENIRLIPPHAIDEPPADLPLPGPIREFLACHSPVLLTVSGLEPEYDLPVQLELIRRLRVRNPRAGLAIIGSGSLDQELRSLSQSKGCEEHVLFAGDVRHQETLCAMRECDVFLRTTLYDGDAVSVREALHLGTPVVATDNGMRPTGVELVPVGDPDALETAIERCLETPASRESRGGSGRENLEAVLALYRELLDDERPSQGHREPLSI